MSIESLLASGSKLWLDSVGPEEVAANVRRGITGATSNPAIIEGIVEKGGLDARIGELLAEGRDDSEIAWTITDGLVRDAQRVFAPIFERTRGDDGYVSFELDPLLEEAGNPLAVSARTAKYVELGKRWSAGHANRMIKVPATAAGIGAMGALAEAGVTLNVTLLFTLDQYRAAREALWAGARRRADGLDRFKSVYSIFISRVDVYTDKHLPGLSEAAQGMVGLLNAKELWKENEAFWADKKLPLRQEVIFASTGKKLDWQAADYYPANLAGSDIQTNPPETLDALDAMDKKYGRTVDVMPERAVIDEIRAKVDFAAMRETLVREGTAKFSRPMRELLERIGRKRGELGEG